MKKLTMCVFIDALGWEIYRKYGFLTQLAPNSRRLKTTFGFSSAADPSILTGRYPDEHTHWSSFIYDPANSPFKWMKVWAKLPPIIFDRWRVRHYLSRVIKASHLWTGYFELYSVPFRYLPYFDYLEKRDYFVPGGILATDTIFDWCVQKEIDYYCSNWRESEENILLANKKKISEAKIKFCYVYLPKLDGIMHNYGPFSEATQAKLKSLEMQISDLFSYASRIYDDVSLYVISDHGMAPVHDSFDLMPLINSLPYEYGKDYIAFYDSTMARFWFFNDQARSAIISLLGSLECGSIVDQEEMKQLRVWFPHDRFGQLYFLMNEGILLNPSFMGLKPIPGMHGYHPDADHSYSIMLSNRTIAQDVQSITDIRKTMESELA
ncbi:MAG: alkaline phosphatase family protein [Candidatus Cloacimonetes bacterium]|jgi:predicted AlkP superfamily pyrophosphatase or phosphodiesterase|nr:alkaline phosphatase family protein [Candidatus Cloacimonadota bacterium]MDD4666632.1 alkaline phosphatase family protein [Candidatus Cloacimonadota bacterium]MDY0336509.1 alkaline phosphatase family protein [Candidatus Cloacimonadaceae bacterium]